MREKNILNSCINPIISITNIFFLSLALSPPHNGTFVREHLSGKYLFFSLLYHWNRHIIFRIISKHTNFDVVKFALQKKIECECVWLFNSGNLRWLSFWNCVHVYLRWNQMFMWGEIEHWNNAQNKVKSLR